MTHSLNVLSNTIQYAFKDKALLKRALTHRSKASVNNERLEFLGDAFLSYFIANTLYHTYLGLSEGELTKLRALLVKRDTLAELASTINLGDFIKLGPGEVSSGGHKRASILSDALEALIAAIYLDGGPKSAEKFLTELYREKLSNPNLLDDTKDPKTELQEQQQLTKNILPEYSVVSVSGKAHEQYFTVCCKLTDSGISTEGRGTTRKKAERDAAKKMLAHLRATK